MDLFESNDIKNIRLLVLVIALTESLKGLIELYNQNIVNHNCIRKSKQKTK